MAIKMVREPSEIPNITNVDDFVGLRYAYGDQSGYCTSKGSEISYSISGSTFTVLSGRLVIQGVECDIDANGVSILVDNITGRRYHTVYAQVSLSTMSVSVLEMNDTVDFPIIPAGDDLNEVTIGTARLPLYTFISQGGVVSSVEKKVHPIKYAYQQVDQLQKGLSDGSVIPKVAQYASSDISKGTIEQRLTNLGFKMGSVSIVGGGSAQLSRQGNYVIVKLTVNNIRWETSSALYQGGSLATLPENFRPKSTISMRIGGEATTEKTMGSTVGFMATLDIFSTGRISLSPPEHRYISGGVITSERCRASVFTLSIGFEAPAIT